MDALTAENKQLLSNNSDQKSLTSGGDAAKKRKRTKSVVNFAKRTDLSLQIEEIEREQEEARQYRTKIKSDSQEDSPIREGYFMKYD